MPEPARKLIIPISFPERTTAGGSPVIKGTKFPVRSVVNYVLRQGIAPEELVKEFSHLTLAQVYDALSYYYDHKEPVDQDLQENSQENLTDP